MNMQQLFIPAAVLNVTGMLTVNRSKVTAAVCVTLI